MLEKLQLTQLIRHGYGGFLLTGIVAFFAPAKLKEAIEAGGAVVAPLVILAIGTAIYVLYRYILGELLLFPFTHSVHWAFDKVFGDGTASSPIGLLAEKGVTLGRRRSAYTDVRRQLFSEDQRKRLDLDHSEAHILWITAVESSGGLLYVSTLATSSTPSTNVWWFFLFASIAVTPAALLHDIQLHRNEYHLLNSSTFNPSLDNFLRANGYTT